MRALVVVAVSAELEALFPDPAASGPATQLASRPGASASGAARAVAYGPVAGAAVDTAAGEVVVVIGGVGPAACAAATATVLAQSRFDVALSAGIAGGFAGFPVGTIVVATRSVAADLGCRTDEAFLPLSELGFGADWYDAAGRWADLLVTRATAAGLTVGMGPITTVSTITGTAAAAEAHQLRTGAAAEAMEGFAVASAAALHGVPFAEIRAVSNAVGPRDVSAWRIGDALAGLGLAVRVAFAEPLPW